ncbi:MAG: hypothetical protein AVDCRST_MAG91-81 [uncultured Sphingomonadaceae bacterium]|uniref:HTH cro/C1-type domain-containing protein n=1 Tax=uncultured Sphingomonadaceae bacterium TaxID=169976 RepID=A0A6J4RUS0_9SPHN|nr:MAG: hypothetical protein AVDCRST_MAG91-81 [uncultured Sphingomonadaceae bacterium]
MAIKTTPYDGSEFLEHTEGQTELLNDALQSGHPGYIARALGTIARARGMSELARITGIGRQSLYAALAEEGNPTLDTLMKVLDALDLELSATPKRETAEPEQAGA